MSFSQRPSDSSKTQTCLDSASPSGTFYVPSPRTALSPLQSSCTLSSGQASITSHSSLSTACSSETVTAKSPCLARGDCSGQGHEKRGVKRKEWDDGLFFIDAKRFMPTAPFNEIWRMKRMSLDNPRHVMWKRLHLLLVYLKDKYPLPRNLETGERDVHPNAFFLRSQTPDKIKELLDRIGEKHLKFVKKVVADKQRKIEPSIEIYDRKSWDNVFFEEKYGLKAKYSPVKTKNLKGERTERFMTVTARVMEMLQSSYTRSKRDLFYLDQDIYSNQGMSDEIIDDVACHFAVSRSLINIHASAGGLLFGQLSWKTCENQEFNCFHRPTTVPENPSMIVSMKAGENVKFVLIVEKEATFLQFIEKAKFFEIIANCILVTGKGYPDTQTKQMVHLIWSFLQIPILCLVDGDPGGIGIMFNYRYGSLGMAYDSENLATPAIRWLGILPSDFDSIKTHDSCKKKLSEIDLRKIEEIKQTPYVKQNESFKKELSILQSKGYKLELTSLNSVDHVFLFNTYLHKKILYGDWL